MSMIARSSATRRPGPTATQMPRPEHYANIDPSNDWTGTWRDLRFVDSVNGIGDHTAVGARPENSSHRPAVRTRRRRRARRARYPCRVHAGAQSLARHRHRTWRRRGYHARHPRLRMGHGARRRKPPGWFDQALRDDHSLERDPSGPGKCRCPRRRNSQPDALPRRRAALSYSVRARCSGAGA